MKTKYTLKDVIVDPNDPRLEGALGKECYVSNFPYIVVSEANSDEYSTILVGISESSIDAPFNVCNDKRPNCFECIILKKVEEPKYRPFKGEELLSVLGRRVIEKDSVSDSYIKILSLITSVALKDEDACIRVDSLWLSAEEFLEKFKFYNDDGTTSPCGVLEEEA